MVLSKFLKRLLSVLLCLAMCVSLLPAAAFAAEDEPLDPPAEVEVTETPDEPEVTEFPDEPEPTETPEEPGEAPAEEELPEAEPQSGAVRLRFVCSPEETVVTLWADGSDEPLQPGEDGDYLLASGDYVYSASCPGYVSVERQSLTLLSGDELREIAVTLEAAEETPDDPDGIDEPDEEKTTPSEDVPEDAEPMNAGKSGNIVDSGFCGANGDNLTWTLYDTGELIISGSGAMANCSYGGAPWYAYKADIQTVSFSDDVTSIGSYAFYNCSGLTRVTIPEGVTSIGSYAFSSCSGLVSVTIPASVTNIGIYAFRYCSGLASAGPVGSESNFIFGWTTSIPGGAFSGCDGLASVTIPDGLTKIGDSAFEGCSSLTSVTIPEGVTSIGNYAFYGCSGLTSVTIPASVTSIGSSVFSGCTGLKTAGPSGQDCNIIFGWTDRIPDNAFSGCSGLTTVTIPTSVTRIGKDAFHNCSSLTSVTIPDNVTNIGTFAFAGCSGLTSITIPSGVTSLSDNIFDGCSSLTNALLPSGLTNVGAGAFSYCSSLKSITLPDGVKTIWNCAFQGCSNLTSLTIPESTTYIGHHAFVDCTALTSLTIPSSVRDLGDHAASGCIALISVAIPSSVTSISAYTFSGCRSLESVTIPEGVKSIGDSAFYGCSGLMSITIPQSVSSLYSGAFDNCSALSDVWYGGSADQWQALYGSGSPNGATVHYNYGLLDSGNCGANGDNLSWEFYDSGALIITGSGAMADYSSGGAPWNSYRSQITSVTLPEGITKIGSRAFYYCSSLPSVTIPSNVTSIGNSAFSGCSSLTAVYICDIAAWCGINFQGEEANPLCSAHNLYLNDTLIETLVVPDGVTSIGAYAFYECRALTSVTIPASVEVIGYQAFNWCTSLETVVSPVWSDFYSCPVSHVTIPEGVTSIRESAFFGCNALTSITIPDGVTSIGAYAFYNCSSLASLTIPVGVTSIGEYAFAGCSALTSITIPAGVTSITESAFSGCSALTSITIPAGVTSIGYSAFNNCSSLESISIPLSLSFIGWNAFYGCNALSTVYYAGNETSRQYHIDYDWFTDGNEQFLNCIWIYTEPEEGWDYCGDMVLWHFDTTTRSLTIRGSGEMWDFDYDAETPWSAHIGRLYYLTIEEGVTSVGERAFSNCAQLRTVSLPAGLLTISFGAFSRCSSLTSMTIPDGVTNIGSSAFFGCHGLMSVTIPASVASIGESAFMECDSLTCIVIPEGVTSIGEMTFSGCSSLSSVTIPLTVSSIGRYAFYNCGQLKCVTIPAGVTEIAEGTFADCQTLASVIFPSSVMSIGSYALGGCAGLKTIYFLGVVPNIRDNSFTGVTADAYYPASAGWWEDDLRGYGGSLTWHPMNSGVCGAGLSWSLSDSGVLTVRGVGAMTDYSRGAAPWAAYLAQIRTLVIEPGATSIGSWAFADCTALTSVTIPDSVTAIGTGAFAGCTGLSGVVIPDSVTTIGAAAFAGCSALGNVSMSDNVTNIGAGAFDGCGQLNIIVSDPDDPPEGVENYPWPEGTAITNGIIAPAQGAIRLQSGKKLQLQASSPLGALVWSVSAADSAFATVSTSGLVTANTVSEDQSITVKAALADGSASIDFHITVYPLAQSVVITDEGGAVVTGGTVSFELNRAGLSSMRFAASVLPDDAPQDVRWSMTDKNKKKVASYADNRDGTVTVQPNGSGNAGTVTLTATASDGSGKTATVKVDFCRPAQAGDGLAITNAPAQLRGGASLALKTNIGGIAALTNRTLIWSLNEGAENYAAISAAGKLTTYPVGEPVSVTVTVCAKENPDARSEVTIELTPAAQSVAVSAPETRMSVGETLSLAASVLPQEAISAGSWSSSSAKIATVDANGAVTALKAGTVTISFAASDGSGAKGSLKLTVFDRTSVQVQTIEVKAKNGVTELQGGKSVHLTASVLPANADKKTVSWSSSDPTLATVSAKGVVTAKKVCASGTVTITAAATDGSGKSGSLDLVIEASAIVPVETVSITGGTEVISGKTLTLKAALTPSKPTVAALAWSSSDPTLATVSAKGVVTAGTVLEPTEVTITAAATDGSGEFAKRVITVYPRTTRVNILRGSAAVNNTVQILDMAESTTLSLTTARLPAGKTMDASVTWKSSNAKIAAVDANGTVTAKKAGTATITATAGDGSGASASFKLTVRASVHGLSIRENDVELRGGTKTTLHVDFDPVNPTNAKVEWSLRPQDGSYATLSGKGVLKAKAITGVHYVVVTAASKEDPRVCASVTVRIYPAVSEVRIFRNGEDVTSKTLTLLPSEFAAGVRLEGLCYPEEARGEVTWKSSNTKIAAVENGAVTFKKRGRVKITCRAADGSGKSAAVILICP